MCSPSSMIHISSSPVVLEAEALTTTSCGSCFSCYQNGFLLTAQPIDPANGPTKSLKLRSKTFNRFNRPISCGKQPFYRKLERTIWREYFRTEARQESDGGERGEEGRREAEEKKRSGCVRELGQEERKKMKKALRGRMVLNKISFNPQFENRVFKLRQTKAK